MRTNLIYENKLSPKNYKKYSYMIYTVNIIINIKARGGYENWLIRKLYL